MNHYPTGTLCTDPNPNCTLKLKCTDHRFHPKPTFHSHTRLRNHDTNLVVRLCKISCPTKLAVEQDRALQNLVRQNRAVLYISRPSTFWTVQLLTFDLTINYHTRIRFSGPSIFIFSAHLSSKNSWILPWLVEFDANNRPVRLKTVYFISSDRPLWIWLIILINATDFDQGTCKGQMWFNWKKNGTTWCLTPETP